MVKDNSYIERRTRCLHMGYSFRLTAMILLYAPSHWQDNTCHGLCYTSRETLAGTRNSSMGPPWSMDPTTNRTMSERSYHGATSRSDFRHIIYFCAGVSLNILSFIYSFIHSYNTPLLNIIAVLSFRFIARRHNSVSSFKNIVIKWNMVVM